MSDPTDRPMRDFGCVLAAVCFLAGVILGAWWAGRGAGDRFDSIERSQERIRARMYEIEKKIEESVDE